MKDNRNPLTIFLYSALIGITVVVTAAFGFIAVPAFAADSISNEVVATVNGFPIYRKDIDAGLPKNVFGSTINMRKTRLDRLIYTNVVKQFIEQENIRIEDQRVDKQFEYLKKYPPSSGCGCCRYDSFEQFKRLNNYAIRDLREDIRVNMGLETYMDRLWLQEHKTEEKRSRLLQENRQYIEKEYINVSHIFFNTFQDPQYSVKPEHVVQQNMKKAAGAVKRLKNGENFETLAKEISEDAVSRENGGLLGCIKKYRFGIPFSNTANKLAFGQYSQPVQSTQGVHIVKRNKITDKDILETLKKQFRERRKKDIVNKIMSEAKIVRYDEKM